MVERFYKRFYFYFLCVYSHMCVLVNAMCILVPVETRRRYWVPMSWSYRCSQARHMADVLGRKLTLVPESKIFSTPFLEVPISYLEIPVLVA